jgi:acetoacetate decarboxylase
VRKEDVLKLPSMPAAGPSYPAGPYRFINREYMVITYETDPDVVHAQLPEPLEPMAQPLVHYEWIKMPDSSGDPLPLQGRGGQFRRADVSRR